MALLVYCLQLLTGHLDLSLSQLSSPEYEGSVTYLCAIVDDGDIRRELPEVPPERYSALKRAAESHCRLYTRSPAAPALAAASEVASDLHRLDKRWSYNGTTCARLGANKVSVTFWLEALQSDLQGIGIRDGKAQGRCLRQLVDGPTRDNLVRKISELPELRLAVERGEATFEDYAAALISCADPDDALACHYDASHPEAQPGREALGRRGTRGPGLPGSRRPQLPAGGCRLLLGRLWSSDLIGTLHLHRPARGARPASTPPS